MHISEFDFDLPAELIAQFPTEQRNASRLLRLDGMSGALQDGWFRQLPDFLQAGGGRSHRPWFACINGLVALFIGSVCSMGNIRRQWQGAMTLKQIQHGCFADKSQQE